MRPLGLGVNEAMLRRNLIATEADSDESDEDSDLWEEEEGAVSGVCFLYFEWTCDN